MEKNWREWHDHYDAPYSPLAVRLAHVQSDLRWALAAAPSGEDGVVNLISLCAGEGRDVLPLLAEQGGSRRVQAILVEFDPIVAQGARKAVANQGQRIFSI